MGRSIAAAALAALVASTSLAGSASAGQTWAVLVCGSRGWWNYRHHADVCHAYHLLRARGVHDDNIITMMYDDVANDSHNPFPGQLYNRPTPAQDKVDVYAGCRKDYTGDAVTPQTFLSVIRGDEEGAKKAKGTHKVLKSTAEDDVFINFVDHGAPGLVAFPSGELYVKDLMEALQEMQSKKMFKKLVFYLEACESGSMFQNLSTAMNVFAVTAANAQESSYATYCPPADDVVGGVHMNSCLGDEFSVNWMEDTDLEKPQEKESLQQQYVRVQNKTKKSHVLEFGTMTLGSDDISEFLGLPGNGSVASNLRSSAGAPVEVSSTAQVDSRDVPLVSKFYSYLRSSSPQAMAELQEELAHRAHVDRLFSALAHDVMQSEHHANLILRAKAPDVITQHHCQRTVNEAYKQMCTKSGFTDYSLKYVATLLAMCEHEDLSTDRIVASILRVCGSLEQSSRL